MVLKKDRLLVTLYALILFPVWFWFDAVSTTILGVGFIISSAFHWGLMGGILSSGWVSGLHCILSVVSGADTSPYGVLLQGILLLSTGLGVGYGFHVLHRKNRAVETTNKRYRELLKETGDLVIEEDRDGGCKCINKMARRDGTDEHRRLITILDSIDSIIYAADMETYELLFINSSGQKKWGHMAGKKCWEVIQEGQSGPCSFCTNNQLIDDEGNPKEVYQWVMKNTKNKRYYICRDQAIRWIDGRLVRLQIATDITEEKEAEKRLKRSEALLRASQQLTRVGGWEWDVEKETMYWTKEAYLLHDFTPGEFDPGSPEHIAQSMECYRPEDQPIIQRAFQDCIEKGEPYDLEFSFTTARERKRWIRTLAKPIIEDGKVLRVIGNIMDITKHKEAETRLEQYASEIELRNLELENLYQYLDSEVEKAIDIHQRTLPQTLPQRDGLSLAAYYQPAEKMGGDFFAAIEKGDQLVMYVSDVTGHGLESALLSTFVKDMVNSYLIFTPKNSITAGEMLRFLFEQYQENNFPEDYFICIYITILNMESMEIEYLGAGLQDTPLLSVNGEKMALKNSGLPISSTFTPDLLNFQEKKMRLKPVSTLLINTDGITEQSVQENIYGERLMDVFYKNDHLPPECIVEKIKDDFSRFNSGSLQGDDDITFLVLKVGEETPS